MRRRMKGLLGGALAASSSSGLSSHHDDPPREQQSTGRTRRSSSQLGRLVNNRAVNWEDQSTTEQSTRRTSEQQSTAARTATSITSTTCTSSDTCPPSAASVCPRFVKECYLSAEEKGIIASNNCSEFVISSVCMCVRGWCYHIIILFKIIFCPGLVSQFLQTSPFWKLNVSTLATKKCEDCSSYQVIREEKPAKDATHFSAISQ